MSVSSNSLDEVNLIASLLRDVSHQIPNLYKFGTDGLTTGVGFTESERRKTIKIVRKRFDSEGMSFLTKTLPSVGKAFDKALANQAPFDCTSLSLTAARRERFGMSNRVRGIGYNYTTRIGKCAVFGTSLNETRICLLPGETLEEYDRRPSAIPLFLEGLFRMVLTDDGVALRQPCIVAIRAIRQLCYLFYKYELPYAVETEQEVINRFVKTDRDLAISDEVLNSIEKLVSLTSTTRDKPQRHIVNIVRTARISLHRLFEYFDARNIVPKHGPGAVSTKERLWNKFIWTNVPERATDQYPFDEYFCTSLGHVCDVYHHWVSGSTAEGFAGSSKYPVSSEVPAQVILVPKDSRGPRVISCEPCALQWLQQGIRRAMVSHIEHHPLTREHVFFTDQRPNQIGALHGSQDPGELFDKGRYATLDLNEASDRVSLELVRLLFPSGLMPYLEATRSVSTRLPDESVLTLRKFAPMGSALCFPIMALTIWALLNAAAPDRYTRERILVYGDDVVVPTAYAEDAMTVLEAVGLKVNRDKSCTKGFFRESCGVDAYQGYDVTPVKLKTVWTSSPSPEAFPAYVAYANAFWDRGMYSTYDYIVRKLVSLYWPIAGGDMKDHAICLRELPNQHRRIPTRNNRKLQKLETRCLGVVSRSLTYTMDGWSMLLRWFTEKAPQLPTGELEDDTPSLENILDVSFESSGSVDQYTRRGSSMLVPLWR